MVSESTAAAYVRGMTNKNTNFMVCLDDASAEHEGAHRLTIGVSAKPRFFQNEATDLPRATTEVWVPMRLKLLVGRRVVLLG